MKDFSARNLKKFSLQMEFEREPINVKLEVELKNKKMYVKMEDLILDRRVSMLVRDEDELKDVLYLIDDIELGAWPRHLENYLRMLDGSTFDIKLVNKQNKKKLISYHLSLTNPCFETTRTFDIESLEDFVRDMYEMCFDLAA